MDKKKRSMGAHILLNLYGLDNKLIEKEPIVMELLTKVVKEAGLTEFGDVSHQFEPVGVTGIILLGESHISIHTWPEYNSAAVDIFSCVGIKEAEKASNLILGYFKPREFEKKVVMR
jgi:S-adenosylmethionine decarboxylase